MEVLFVNIMGAWGSLAFQLDVKADKIGLKLFSKL
ncbi:hypothetical protein SAG0079_07585 [Streptococcus agalactiae CCUG 49087]|nr:hypothetical protein SAG0084_02005 [Streptococcus agalactiae LMG 15085]EPT76397.1 hypothetical protein SAG0079_07585 [Streptococcus agalactiae CCUG 49087]EPT79220.1 hypothetical protein SAG0087_01775 [Streptococcus agalactiae LMG 15091]EPT83291.1 hypothetical protein SAG0091_08935 [Streptococcus agalactiae LMG 15095]EPT89283.1 hypothetical protein SAG0102_05970 [Streptococcus agalactiae BSU188]EPU01410.1 hypothetical protein SAG0109_09655 [Streptococcus agalactiae BSU108]EPU59003.1 hypothe